jgi:hypothetical protein
VIDPVFFTLDEVLAIHSDLSREETAALVCTALDESGISVVLSGGAVVSIYSECTKKCRVHRELLAKPDIDHAIARAWEVFEKVWPGSKATAILEWTARSRAEISCSEWVL